MAEQVKVTIIGRAIDRVTSVMSLAGALVCLAVAVLVNLDILLRFLFSAPMPGVPEIVALAIVGICFLQLPGCIISEGMTRSDLLVVTLRRHRPRVGRALDAIMCLLGIVPLAIVAWSTFPRVFSEYYANEYVGTLGLFTFPAWPVSLFIALGCLFGCLQLARLALRALGSTRQETDELVAELRS